MKQAPRRAGMFTTSEQRLTATSVERRLWCVEGFAWLHGPGLLGLRARRSFDVWRVAEERAVVPVIALRKLDDTAAARRWVTYLFWTQGAVSVAVDGLIARAAALDPGEMRRESLPYTDLSPWRGAGRSYDSFEAPGDEVALTLSDPARGRYAFTQRGRSTSPESDLVVWAKLNGVDYIHPVRGDLTC